MVMFCTESSVVMFYYVFLYSLGFFYCFMCFYVFCAAHYAYSINIYSELFCFIFSKGKSRIYLSPSRATLYYEVLIGLW